MSEEPAIEDIEVALLLEAVQRRYGHELRNWEAGRIRKRVQQVVSEGEFSSISALQEKILRDEVWLGRLMAGLWSQPNRGMFADPAFWRALRWKVIPFLRTWPTVRCWVAGCATGEDAWSLAVLLDEEGLGNRAVIHATDLDEAMMTGARAGTATPTQLSAWEANYRRSGGLGSLGQYFQEVEGVRTLRPPVSERIAYSRHVPAIEPSFNEFHLILFRNPFVWTERTAAQRVGTLLRDSQVRFGFLCVYDAATMRFLPRATWDLIDPDVAIARRIE